MDANLLVTYEPTHRAKASEEVKSLLEPITESSFEESEHDGIFLVKTKKDPKKIVAALHELCEKEPHRFRYTYRWTPIEKWTSTKEEDMEKIVRSFEKEIKPEESWKMDIGVRGYELEARKLLLKLTEQINRPKVDLRNPDKILKIEVVGNNAGLSVLGRKEYLNTSEVKQ